MTRCGLALLLCLLTMALTLRISFGAEPETWSVEQYFDLEQLTDALPEEGREVLDELGLDASGTDSLLALSPEQFLKTAGAAFSDAFRQPARMLAVLTGAALLTLMLDGFQDLHGNRTMKPVFGAVTVLCLAAVVAGPVLDCLGDASRTVDGAAGFLTAYIPVMTGILLTAGRSASAVSYNTLMFLGCEGAAQLIHSVFLPVTGILLALGLTGAVTGDSRLSGVSRMIRKTAGWALGLVLILFIGLMTLQTGVSAAADTVASRSAKYLLGSLVPVVGSSVSDAVMAARGCVDLIRTSVGGFGLVAVAAIFLLPAVRVLAWYCAFSAGAFLGELLGAGPLRSLMENFASGFGLLLSVLAAFAAVAASCTGLLLSVGGAG